MTAPRPFLHQHIRLAARARADRRFAVGMVTLCVLVAAGLFFGWLP